MTAPDRPPAGPSPDGPPPGPRHGRTLVMTRGTGTSPMQPGTPHPDAPPGPASPSKLAIWSLAVGLLLLIGAGSVMVRLVGVGIMVAGMTGGAR